MKLAALDIVIIVAYVAILVYITWRSRRFAGRSLENYYLAGRNMPGWMTGISYAASMMSADSAVAYGGLAVITGVFVCWFYLSRFGIALFLGAVLFAVFWRRLNTFTTLEFYELRFEGLPGTLMRLWLALRTSLIAMVAWTGISLLALVKLSKPVLGLEKTETLALALPLAVAYVYLSGYLGVVLGNLVQIAVMTAGSFVLAAKTLLAVGGAHQLAVKLAALGPSTLNGFPPVNDPIFPAVACLAWLIGTSIGYGGDAAPMGGAVEGQRILSSKTPKDACRMYIVTEVTIFSLVWLVSVPCLAAAVFWPGLRSGALDRELAYGLLMTNYLGPGLLGLVFVAMLAGIISVVGDNLNFGSQVLLNDIYRRYLVTNASERHYMIAGRLAIFVILGLALLVVYKVSFVFDVAIFMVGLSASEMSANWAQWWWWRFNGWGRVAASFGGGLSYMAIYFLWPAAPWWNRMFAASMISTVLWIIVTLLTAPEGNQRLIDFYRRTRPLGSWKPIRRQAEAAEPQPMVRHGWKAVYQGILLALVGAAAVMAYIVGISRMFVGQYAKGAATLVFMPCLAVVFWLKFEPYISSLLSAEEQKQMEVLEHASARSAKTFGLAGLAAFSAFAAASVFAIHWFFLGGRTRSSLPLAVLAALAGIWLWRKHGELS